MPHSLSQPLTADNSKWEPVSVKAQLRRTSLRLSQLQERKDSQEAAVHRDIATLLQQRNVGLARAKAQELLRDEAMGDLLEVLGTRVGQLLEHFAELEQRFSSPPSPHVIDAASTIIYAAPYVGSTDLNIVSNLLIQHLGPNFPGNAKWGHENRATSIIIQAITSPPIAETLDAMLQKIANDHGVKWLPEPTYQETLAAISSILDSQSSPTVDIEKLRCLCIRGLPSESSWLRPRIWQLFLGILPVSKTLWTNEIRKQRDSYYVALVPSLFSSKTHFRIAQDLIQQLLEPLSELPPPTLPVTGRDAVLLEILKQLSNIPPALFSGLVNTPESFESRPLDENASNKIKITSTRNLDIRLEHLLRYRTEESLLVARHSHRFESPVDGTSETSRFLLATNPANATSKPLAIMPVSCVHPSHASALLRLLYLHTLINPGNVSPHIYSLLVPIYLVMNQNTISEDLAHAEADTFWLFEAMVGEFSEFSDEAFGSVWTKRFSERLAWADPELFQNLRARGLDPALPHYSYQWLAPLLTHTLPVSSILPIWDVLFTCPMRIQNRNPKIDCLLDISSAMLVCLRTTLFRLGKSENLPSLQAAGTLSSLHTWEVRHTFLDGMSLLQPFPVETAGGIDRILQTASYLRYQRDEKAKIIQKNKLTLSARVGVAMWKGFTNQQSSPESSPEESEDDLSEHDEDDRNNTEMPDEAEPGFTTKLATTIWRGMTNQGAMELPASPLSPASPMEPHSPLDQRSTGTSQNEYSRLNSSLRAYTHKVMESDTLATFAKVSSNWRAKAVMSSWGRYVQLRQDESSASPKSPLESESASRSHSPKPEGLQRGALPLLTKAKAYSPPPRPQYFGPPRDNFVFPAKLNMRPATLSPEAEDKYTKYPLGGTHGLHASLAALTGAFPSQNATKSGPRPLLLSISPSVISPPNRPVSRSAGSVIMSDHNEWVDVIMRKGHGLHRESQSSASSLSPSDALRSTRSSRSDWDSDTGSSSRRVPLNRHSVSPMAPGFKTRQERSISGPSSAASSDRGLISPSLSTWSKLQNNNHTAMIPHHPPPPVSSTIQSSGLPGNGDHPLLQAETVLPKCIADETLDSSIVRLPSRSPRPTSKRYITRPPILNIEQDNTSHLRPIVDKNLSHPNILGVEWPADDKEIARTPRASSFNHNPTNLFTPPKEPLKSLWRPRRASTEMQNSFTKIPSNAIGARPRKVSSGQRTRKFPNEQKESRRRSRDSSAEDGDDEGYGDLLNAYESENS